MQEEYLLLIKDSFTAGTAVISSGESILPVMLNYAENYNLAVVFICAYFANTLAILLNYAVVYVFISLIEKYSLLGDELKKINPDPTKHKFNCLAWPLLFLSPLGSVGTSFMLVFGLFKMPYKTVLSIVPLVNLVYYIALYFGFRNIFGYSMIILTVLILAKPIFSLLKEFFAAFVDRIKYFIRLLTIKK